MLSAANAHAHKVDLNLILGLNLGTPSVSPAPANGAYTMGLGISTGGLVGITFTPLLSLETGFQFAQRITAYNSRDATGAYTSGSKEYDHFLFPVTLRFNVWADLYLGLGLYGAVGIGNVNNWGATLGIPFSSSQSFEDARRGRFDMGMIYHITYRMPLWKWLSLFMDFRFYFGFINTDFSGGGASAYYRDLQIQSGLSFML
jgi:hypothetical protein